MASETENRRERDMILAPNEYCFISDETKGEVNCFVGPNKTSLAGTDRCVTFDTKSKRFRQATLEQGTQTFMTAPEGWYIILKNPANGDKHPGGSGKLTTPDLKVGKKVNISGPASFALWPGQMAKVIQGHNLRSNEYLLVRVYDEEAARANFAKSIIKTQSTETSPVPADGASPAPAAAKPSKTEAPKEPTATNAILSEKDLTMGKLFVIRGTDVSFYIPSTGIEVVPERTGGEERYVREAVSLERLEYCLLLDQDGTKRYVHGPAVVFPRPTEKFVDAPIKSNPEKAKAKKFRAQELTPASGIHIRVIADYTDDKGTKRLAGEELFITGKEQTIYFPREEHAIIRYGEQEIHYGIAIPAGEARYVLDRDTGRISLVKGPQIFLPDPRNQVITQRALGLNLCGLMYPGNEEAMAINAARLQIDDQDIINSASSEALLNASAAGFADMATYGASAAVVTPDTSRRVMIRGASKALPGDQFDRKNKFTKPREIVLNTKFDGAVSTDIWTGYAMMLVSKSGDRRVVQGPQTVLLEFDEAPQVMTLSRGKPKTMDNPLKTVFLLTRANKVSDIIDVETRDFVKLKVKLSYRVNFEGDNPETWFAVDNYVKFLCDHMRSRIRAAVQKLGIEEFYHNHTDLLRDVILGKALESKSRTGTLFTENNMRIYDVEVLGVEMQNSDIEKMLVNAQRNVVEQTLTLASDRRKAEHIRLSEEIKREIEETNAETFRKRMEIQTANAKLQLEADLLRLENAAKTQAAEFQNNKSKQEAANAISSIELDARIAAHEAQQELDRTAQTLRLEALKAEVQAIVDKATAISPGLIEALNSFGERAMVERVAESMAPLGIIGGKSVTDVLAQLLQGTKLAQQLLPAEVGAKKPNGGSRGITPAE